ncbi:hypothetical protein NDU88_004226 [Pleurodeles waltl]|uniref:Uncharacterized protein n=1 Tax=Pleurodeles waltl TaxID=8319 RepID=A0AAV7VJQ2_PLEWA|nr:hypothetical protein NDU88_004226 [Pleurodeles waltl]
MCSSIPIVTFQKEQVAAGSQQQEAEEAQQEDAEERRGCTAGELIADAEEPAATEDSPEMWTGDWWTPPEKICMPTGELLQCVARYRCMAKRHGLLPLRDKAHVNMDQGVVRETTLQYSRVSDLGH